MALLLGWIIAIPYYQAAPTLYLSQSFVLSRLAGSCESLLQTAFRRQPA